MVDSETTAATGGIVDCSVGSLVWVRRRNGSWWPGKILGPDDLSSSLITSPHSGTPVKLLGREDAIVDWYNLEKSKRVKSFRCGDFNECIERAESAPGFPPKKREKYARREDAILHALELERQMLEKYGNLGYPSNGRYQKSKDGITSREHLEQGGGDQNNPGSDKISERLAEKSVTDVLLCVERGREESQVSGDDDSPGALPRMRSLQDFGLLTVPPPREELSKVSSCSKKSRYAYPQYDSGDSSHVNRVQPSMLQTTVSKVNGRTWNSKSSMREYREDSVFDSRQHIDSRIMLVDVDLKVKLNNYPRDVPMISLTSKLNGHPIVGHPIQIEALERGATDRLLEAAGYFSPESLECSTALRPVWRTRRRTAKSRVPRPRYVDENKKLGFSGNSLKKTCPSSKQKIRTLSSIPLELKHHRNLACGGISDQVDGLIKTVPTAVACIPVKLVFSRLHEKLIGRHQ